LKEELERIRKGSQDHQEKERGRREGVALEEGEGIEEREGAGGYSKEKSKEEFF
jgi:hypothetical protein